MAQIPLGNFGYAAPEIRRSQTVSTVVENNSGAMTAKIIGDAVSDVSSQFKANLELQSELESRKKRNKASTLRNEYETKLQTAELDLERQHAEGTIGSDALLPAWEQTAKKLKDELTPFADELDDETRAEFVSSLEGTRVNGLARFQGSALNAAKKDHQSSVTESWDSFRKNNLGNYEAASAWLDGEGGAEMQRAFGADAPEKIRKAKEQASLDSVTLAITNAGDDAGSLSRVHQQLQSKEAIARLDPDKWMAINSSLQGRIDSLNERAAAKAEANQYKAERKAELSYEQTMKHIANGGTLAPETMVELESTTKGTAYEGATKIALQSQAETQEFLRKDETTQQAILTSARADMQRTGSTPAQLEHVNNLEKLANERAKERKDNPYAAHEKETGLEPVFIDFSSTESIDPQAIADRTAQRDMLTRKSGRDPGFLKPEEKQSLVQKLSNANPSQKAKVFADIQSSTDAKTYNVIMKDIYGDDPVAAHAGQLYAIGTKQASDTSVNILRGQEILADENMKDSIPSKSKFDEGMKNTVGNSFAGASEAYGKARETVMANYAAMAEKKGLFGSEIDDDLMADAVSMTLGTPVELNDQRVLAPWGMSEDDFVAKARASWEATGAVTDFSDINLLPAGDGRYLAAKGSTPIKKQGKPVYIEVK